MKTLNEVSMCDNMTENGGFRGLFPTPFPPRPNPSAWFSVPFALSTSTAWLDFAYCFSIPLLDFDLLRPLPLFQKPRGGGVPVEVYLPGHILQLLKLLGWRHIRSQAGENVKLAAS